jgi:nucleoside 2-deoxyribosyltransferase
MVTAYIASPLGFSETTIDFYRARLLPAIEAAGVEPLDPWADPDAPSEFNEANALPTRDGRVAALREVNTRLGIANADLIGRADGVLAVLDGADVDSGTAAEIGYAAALDKPIVGLRLDSRRAGDNDGAIVNLQVEHFIMRSGGDLVHTIEDAARLLALLLRA